MKEKLNSSAQIEKQIPDSENRLCLSQQDKLVLLLSSKRDIFPALILRKMDLLPTRLWS